MKGCHEDVLLLVWLNCGSGAICCDFDVHVWRRVDYPLDEDGYIDSEGFAVPREKEALARRGARACPERIIFIDEDD